MNNLGSMYRFEVRKIVCRKITAIAMIAVVLLMVAMSIGEHVSGAKIVNKEELVLVGRAIDDKMLDEMRAAVEPKPSPWMTEHRSLSESVSTTPRISP